MSRSTKAPKSTCWWIRRIQMFFRTHFCESFEIESLWPILTAEHCQSLRKSKAFFASGHNFWLCCFGRYGFGKPITHRRVLVLCCPLATDMSLVGRFVQSTGANPKPSRHWWYSLKWDEIRVICPLQMTAEPLEQWFSNYFWSRTICVSRTVIMYHLAPEKVNVPNIIRSNVWKTRIDTNATWTKCLWEILMAVFRKQQGK